MPAPQPGRPRSVLSDADRDRLVALLCEHYAQGGLSGGEFDRRVGMVLSAGFTDEAAPAVDDLPPLAVPASVRDGKGRQARTRDRRHAQAAAPGAGWLPTQERFRDPTTGKIMRVWIDPADHSRHYVPEGPS